MILGQGSGWRLMVGWCMAMAAGAMLACDAPRPTLDELSKRDPRRGLDTASAAITVVDLRGDQLDPLVWNNTGSERTWRVNDGVIRSEGATNRPLWLMSPRLDPYVRVEFKARTLSPLGELRFEMFGDGEHHESGYVLVLGAWGHVAHIIARMDEHWTDAYGSEPEATEQARVMALENTALEPGRWYQMQVVRTDAELRWFVDGQLLLSYPDPEPLMGVGHQYFGISNWSSVVEIAELRIVQLEGETP
ncbi:MAG: hypothetical protein AAFS10_14300 [Myxococcota bacterium]